ncbi:uncharacterized protein LOC123508896 [Portunus trituberculatus]|uniref:uncharacterized protein LOC123508896 n=1 Tax=Portunus trituberculatus TaxID=210409 RepID=UPI001E1CC900|nr:uncharacterized protein LOC123508896 [Portunus trituberculatus]
MLRALVVMVVVLVAMVVEGGTADHVTPSKHSKLRIRRDYGMTNDPVMNDPQPADDSGFYYYYYPVEDDIKGKEKYKDDLYYKDDKDYKCSAEKLLAPLIIISIFLGIIAFSSVGLVPSFNLPPINIPELEINRGSRSLVSSAAEFLPWGTLNNMTEAVLAAVEGEECRPWLVCESGRLAEGRTTALSLMELLAPRKYQQEVRIFKDSALLRTSCDKYKCSSFKKPACVLLQAMGGRC